MHEYSLMSDSAPTRFQLALMHMRRCNAFLTRTRHAILLVVVKKCERCADVLRYMLRFTCCSVDLSTDTPIRR